MKEHQKVETSEGVAYAIYLKSMNSNNVLKQSARASRHEQGPGEQQGLHNPVKSYDELRRPAIDRSRGEASS